MDRSKTTGTIATIVFHALTLMALFMWGMPVPPPPPQEDGMLISFGDSETGFGNQPSMQKETPAMPASPTENENNNEQKESILTQDYEDAPTVPKRERRRKQNKERRNEAPANTSVHKENTQEPQRVVNRDALFSGKIAGVDARNAGSGSNGSPAQSQGTTDGNPNAAGTSGNSGGNSVNLSGRSLVGALSVPKYDVQEAGRVVVKIRVDRSGNVVEAKAQQIGSTLMNAALYAAAEQAASKTKFNPSKDDAPLYQNGTIVYVFKMSGN
jgi:TonB family protein